METEEIKALARDCGFSVAEALDPATLAFMPEVRQMCAADKCRSYDKNWSCPPAAGALEALAEKCGGYGKGLLVQTVGKLEDEFDIETMSELGERHNRQFNDFAARLKARGADALPMGMGACTRCKKCSYPDEPCRFPELMFPSMEACGLLVSQICTDNGVPYYYGRDTLSYTSCVLFN